MRIGYFESAQFQKSGLRLIGWALDTDAREPPTRIIYVHGDFEHSLQCCDLRSDVERIHGVSTCGFSAEVNVAFNDRMGESEAKVIAVWQDGSTSELPRLRNGVYEPSSMRFRTLEEFDRAYQNPAFRTKNKQLLVWAARRALNMSRPDENLFMAAACVLTYRHIEDDLVSADEIREVMQRCHTTRAKLNHIASGAALRWVGSTHLAFGYAYLSWSQFDEARREFDAICARVDSFESWPQAATNVAIAHFVAGWLAWRSKDSAHALQRLQASLTILRPAGTVKIWNWHQYEEFRGVVTACQQCFTLMKFIEWERAEHILPSSATISFERVSRVLGVLARKGIISDDMLPKRDCIALEKPPKNFAA
ncbi:hypothetical protein ACD578_27565 (plasmid) [Microvirga sp. RSM25]|uniref:hypothetical protein n=1 Tax=Microvirga sp. RSM25 TaxID=3273802 RepID=UPI00385104F4